MRLSRTARLSPAEVDVEALDLLTAARVSSNVGAEAEVRLLGVIAAVVHLSGHEGEAAGLTGQLLEPSPDLPVDLVVDEVDVNDAVPFHFPVQRAGILEARVDVEEFRVPIADAKSFRIVHLRHSDDAMAMAVVMVLRSMVDG